MTPAWRNSALTTTSEVAVAAVCDAAAREPALDRPDFTATIGLSWLTRRAIRANLRGFPNDSRYMRITSVSSSCSQYWRRSLPLMSALLPTDTNDEMPSSSSVLQSMSAMPSPPDWDWNATRPGMGRPGMNVAFEARRRC